MMRAFHICELTLVLFRPNYSRRTTVRTGLLKTGALGGFIWLVSILGPSAGAQTGSLTGYLIPNSCGTPVNGGITEIVRIDVPEPLDVGLEAADDAAAGSGVIPGYAIDALPAAEVRFEVRDASGKALACGEVGGSFTRDGALIVGLREVANSNVTGIVYLSPVAANPGNTAASFFVSGSDLVDLSHAAAAAPTMETARAVPTTPASASSGQSVSAAESAYINRVTPIFSTVASSMGDFSRLMQNPEIGNDIWTLNVATQLVIWQQSYTGFQEVVPPPAFAGIHANILEALRLLSGAGTKIANGIDRWDIALLNEASVDIQNATTLIDLANDQLNELKRQRGL
jgi:hypothetical protein